MGRPSLSHYVSACLICTMSAGHVLPILLAETEGASTLLSCSAKCRQCWQSNRESRSKWQRQALRKKSGAK